MKSIYVFCTGPAIGYITGHIIQGAIGCGVTIYSNLTSPKGDGRHLPARLDASLIQYRAQPESDDLIIIDETRQLSLLEDHGAFFFQSLLQRGDRNKIILVAGADDVNLTKYPSEIPCFLAHSLPGFTKNPKSFPIGWGFTAEGFEHSKEESSSYRRDLRIIQNFNPTYSQSVRESFLAAAIGIPALTTLLDSRHLHGDEYTTQLKTSQFCLCIGGSFFWPKSDYQYLRDRMSENSLQQEKFEIRDRLVGIFRWDSFRFWESIAFGCIPIQLDFEVYGFSLPIIPKKWEHYIPLSLANISKTVDDLIELSSNENRLREFSDCSKAWAIENYHPEKVFNYILECRKEFYKNTLNYT